MAPVLDVADETRVTHLVLTIDLSLAEPDAPQKVQATVAATTAFAGLLRRSCEEPGINSEKSH